MEDISPVSSLEYLYETVLKDFFLIVSKAMKENHESKEGKEKKEEKVPKNSKTSLEDLFKDCNDFFNAPSISKSAQEYYPKLYEFSKKYLNDIDELIEGKSKIENYPVIKIKEHDIYLSYGILCCFGIIFQGMDLEKVSKFNYNEYPNFNRFIQLYGNAKNLSDNYNTNFLSFLKDKKMDLKLINNWMKKLDEKLLTPMQTKKKMKHHKKNKNKISNGANTDRKDLDDTQEKTTSDTKKKDDYNKTQHIEGKNGENLSKEKKEEKNEIIKINNDEENKNNLSNNIEKNDSGNNIANTKEEISDNQNKINEENNAPLIKINDKNENIKDENTPISKDEKPKGKISDASNVLKEMEENSEFSKKQKEENNEINKINTNSNSSNNVQLIKNWKKRKKMISQNKALRKIIYKMNGKIEGLEKKVDGLNKRVGKLEINQLLLYHQISMYQTSRDIYKSISTYFFEYLELKKLCINPFEKLKAVLDYTKEKDVNKLKTMQYNATKIIPDEIKTKLLNYFKLHFFLNKVSNKIVHRNFSEEEKRILKEQNNDDNLMPLIPDFDFDQCFDTLEYFIENNAKNNQIKKAMEIVYDEKYIKDQNLGPIKDIEGEVISRDENGIHILYNKEDLKDIRTYFNGLTIGDKSFVKLCNDKLWDREEFEFN